jgi:hypothetical protein
MNLLLQKLQRVGEKLQKERGRIVLLGLFMREDSVDMGLWDVVISAPWLDETDLDVKRYVASEMRKVLGQKAMRDLSRIVVMETTDPAVKHLAEELTTKPKPVLVGQCEFAGAQIRSAYVVLANDRQYTDVVQA